MNRSMLAFIGIFAVVFIGAIFLLREFNPPRQPAPAVPALQAIQDNNAAKVAPPRPDPPRADPKPAIPKQPLVLGRWKVPAQLMEPDIRGDVRWLIDPAGPRVVVLSKSGAVAWDAASNQTGPTEPLAAQTIIRTAKNSNDRWVYQIISRKTGKKLLELPESPARAACFTPDGKRLIVIGNPSKYSAQTYIKIPSGETVTRPAYFYRNVRVFNIQTSEQLADFGARDKGLDDDIWAVAAAPDGKSFFVASRKELVQISFETAFQIPALPPASR